MAAADGGRKPLLASTTTPARTPLQALTASSDGWRDDELPRRIRYWTEDRQLLPGLVRSGSALASLPDFALAGADLVRIHVVDCAFLCTGQAFLVWDSASAAQWQHGLARALQAGHTRQS